MNATQLTFFPDPGNALDQAALLVGQHPLEHYHYMSCVREAEAKVHGQRPGSIILCAAPADIACDELISTLQKTLESEHESKGRGPFGGMSVISMPAGYRRRAGAQSIFDSYRAAVETPGVTHRRPPEFQLELGWSVAVQNQFDVISSLIQRRPAEVYVFKNVHLLQSFGGGTAEAIDALIMLAELAYQSKRTHVLIGHTKVVLDWLRHASVARLTSACILAPYDPDVKLDLAQFTEIARAYDRKIPWQTGESLASRIPDINKVVAGCPHRLRKWICAAICKARAENEEKLSWSRMLSTRLLPAETAEAWAELTKVRGFLRADLPGSNTDQPDDSAKPPAKGNRSPGQRLPNRNAVQAA